MIHGSYVGNTPLDFSSSAVKGCTGLRVEMKVCEAGYCGGLRFTREVPKSAKLGERVCQACAARIRTEVGAGQVRVWLPVQAENHWRKQMSRMVM